MQVMNRRGVCD